MTSSPAMMQVLKIIRGFRQVRPGHVFKPRVSALPIARVCVVALVAATMVYISAAQAGRSLTVEVYSGSTSRPFEDVLEDLELAVTEANYRITGRNRIGRAISERENIKFPGSTVVHFCNLVIAQQILELAPDFLIHMPCIAVVYERDGRVFAETRLVPEDERLGQLAIDVNNLLKSIIDYAVEE